MANVGIAMEWGGQWNAGERRHVGPYVRAALDIAAQGVEQLGIIPKMPKKAYVWKSASTYLPAGETFSADSFDLNVPFRIAQHRKIQAIMNGLTLVGAHEDTHCIRREEFASPGLMEAAATEAVAHQAEDAVGDMLLGEEDFNPNRLVVPPISEDGLKRLLDRFYADDVMQAEMYGATDATDPIYERWFEEPVEGSPLPLGVILAMHLSRRHMDNGASIKELLHWPADEIIRL